jgi:hypothetical protein
MTLHGSSNVSSTPTGLEVTGQPVAYGVGVTDNGPGVAPSGTRALLGHANAQAFQHGVMGMRLPAAPPASSETR